MAGDNGTTNPIFVDAFPGIDLSTAVPTQGQVGITPDGAAGFQWMTINMEVDTTAVGPSGMTNDPGIAHITIHSASSGNTVEIGTIDNSNGSDVVSPQDNIGLLLSDFFPSVTVNSAFSFAIFDNVQVFSGLVPLPGDLTADKDNDVDGRDFLTIQLYAPSLIPQWETQYDTGPGALGSSPRIVETSQAVPEPSPHMLLLIVTVAATGARGRQSRANRRRSRPCQ